MSINKLFVYGTLRKGESRSIKLLDFEFINTFKLPGRIYNTDYNFPVAVYDQNSSTCIHGEFYKIPENPEYLEEIDIVEGVKNDLFKRSGISYKKENFYLYEPGKRLSSFIKPQYLIKNGNWLTEYGLATTDPVSFAFNFEENHKKYYNKETSGVPDQTVFLEGNYPVLISCPHSTKHNRLGKLKSQEFYTAAIGAILHSRLDCSCIYSNRIQNSDPNYYDGSGFKEELKKVITKNNIKLVVDIHGTGEYRKFDIYPGIGNKKEFLLGNEMIIELFYEKTKKYNLSVGGLDVFPAVKQNTITKFSAIKLNVPSMQIEIKKGLRTPDNKSEFLNLINMLSEFLKELKLHSPSHL